MGFPRTLFGGKCPVEDSQEEYQLIVAQLWLMATGTCVNIGSGNGLLPDSTKKFEHYAFRIIATSPRGHWVTSVIFSHHLFWMIRSCGHHKTVMIDRESGKKRLTLQTHCACWWPSTVLGNLQALWWSSLCPVEYLKDQPYIFLIGLEKFSWKCFWYC